MFTPSISPAATMRSPLPACLGEKRRLCPLICSLIAEQLPRSACGVTTSQSRRGVDETALLRPATLNRLEGKDVPARRAELLAQLSALTPVEVLSTLLPEDASQIEQTLSLLDLASAALLADLMRAAADAQRAASRQRSVAVPAEDR